MTAIPTYPKARKPHTCDDCGRTIRPRERYGRIAHFEGGTAFTSKFCAHCVELWYAALEIEGVGRYDSIEFDLDEWVASMQQMAAYIPPGSRDGVFAHRFVADVQEVLDQRKRKWAYLTDPDLITPLPRVLWREDSYGFGRIYGIKPGDAGEPYAPWFDIRYWFDHSRGRTIDLSIDTPDTLPPNTYTNSTGSTAAEPNLKET